MIEDKSIGLKIAENEDEDLWYKQKSALEGEISNLKKLIKINEAYLEKTNEIISKFPIKFEEPAKSL